MKMCPADGNILSEDGVCGYCGNTPQAYASPKDEPIGNAELALVLMEYIGLEPCILRAPSVLRLIGDALDIISPDEAEMSELAESAALAFHGWANILDDGNGARYPIKDWQYEVANGDTKLGYDEWREHKHESE